MIQLFIAHLPETVAQLNDIELFESNPLTVHFELLASEPAPLPFSLLVVLPAKYLQYKGCLHKP